MRWFGEPWKGLVCFETEHVSTPEGRLCGYCQKPIKKKDRGVLIWGNSGGAEVPYELGCFMEMLGLEKEAADGLSR